MPFLIPHTKMIGEAWRALPRSSDQHVRIPVVSWLHRGKNCTLARESDSRQQQAIAAMEISTTLTRRPRLFSAIFLVVCLCHYVTVQANIPGEYITVHVYVPVRTP